MVVSATDGCITWDQKFVASVNIGDEIDWMSVHTGEQRTIDPASRWVLAPGRPWSGSVVLGPDIADPSVVYRPADLEAKPANHRGNHTSATDTGGATAPPPGRPGREVDTERAPELARAARRVDVRRRRGTRPESNERLV